MEATRCLGELGPRDITTMVFQIEKNCLDLKCSPQVFVTGQILALLSDYVVDENVNVIKISCRLLCEILLYKEGKIVTGKSRFFDFVLSVPNEGVINYFA